MATEEFRIVVCLKQVMDPEAPASSFRIDPETKSISGQGVPPVINPYDESALEQAVRIKEANTGVRIAAVAFGRKLARAVMMKSLAVGADELHLIEDESIEADGCITAAVLAAAIGKIGFDLVLAGRQAADTNSGGVGLALAEILGIPALSWAKKIELDGKTLKVERVVPDGREILRGPVPALITVSHEAGELRLAKLPDIRKAKQKPIHSLGIAELGIKETPQKGIECVSIEAPKRDRACRIVEGETPEQAAVNLAQTLIDDRVINIT